MKKKIIYNEKRKFFFMVQNLKWATAHLSRTLGAGLGARHSDTTRRPGARHGAGRMGALARGRQASGRWGAGHAGNGRQARGQARRGRTGARG